MNRASHGVTLMSYRDRTKLTNSPTRGVDSYFLVSMKWVSDAEQGPEVSQCQSSGGEEGGLFN